MTCAKGAGAPGNARDSRHAPTGFTLAEVVVVLGVMAILAAIALPHFDRTAVNLDVQEQNIRGALLMAQRLAIVRGCDVVVAFDEAGRQLRVQEDPDGDMASDPGEGERWTQIEGDVRFGRGSAPALKGVTDDIGFAGRQAGRPAFVFHRDGSASERGLFYVTSVRGAQADYAGDARAFELQRATGRLVGWRYTSAGWRKENR